MIADDDPKLIAMDRRVGEKTHNSSGWERFGFLLLAADQVDKAEAFFHLSYGEASDDYKRLAYSNDLGYVYLKMRKYSHALPFFEETLAVLEKLQPWLDFIAPLV